MIISPDFTEYTKQTLAKRAGQVCSNPDCRKPTSGPHSEEDKAINLGQAAHIRAARNGWARYDPNMTNEQRKRISNGIWLCIECARKIDLDENKYTIKLLKEWKKIHEKWITEGKLATNKSYIDKTIFNDKASSLLTITDNLQKISHIISVTTNIILNKKRHIKKALLKKIHKETQKLTGIKPNPKLPYLEEKKQRKLISKQIKKLNLPKEYDDEYVRLFLTSTWALDKYDKGISAQLEASDEYITLNDELDGLISKLSDKNIVTAINAYKNTSLGLNSLMLFVSYFPSNVKNQYFFMNKPLSQWKIEINQILSVLLVDIREKIEEELKRQIN